MGFTLRGFLTTEPAALTLYESVLPARAWAVRTEGAGLPPAWLLPTPYELGLEPENLAADWFAPDHGPEWARLAGIPDGPPPLWAFEQENLQLASLLSLAADAGVALIDDETFGGIIDHEYAAVFVAGRLRAAAGFGRDYADDSLIRGFSLHGPAWHEVESGPLTPIADCAAVIDPAFGGAFLFDGYLPRKLDSEDPDEAPALSLTIEPGLVRDWAPYFPILRRVSS